jgi:molybdopterin adenylyltransferase
MNVGIITVSDRASAGEYEDHGGPALQAESEKRDWHVLADAIVPDDKERIKEVILSFEAQGCNLILTTGGTGITERDVTPEALREVMRVEIDGFGELMRMRSVDITPNAILSRGLPGKVITREFPTTAAKPRERIAFGVMSTLRIRINSPKPSISTLMTSLRASGVTSRSVIPVPPVVNIKLQP